jgi:hypothetical protein
VLFQASPEFLQALKELNNPQDIDYPLESELASPRGDKDINIVFLVANTVKMKKNFQFAKSIAKTMVRSL